MVDKITVDWERAREFVTGADLDDLRSRLEGAGKKLVEKTGSGKEFLGWLDLPVKGISALGAIEEEAARIRAEAEALVVIGIGGSYLGARAVIEALSEPGRSPIIYYAGHNLSAEHLGKIREQIKSKRVFLNVISKSGTTTEPGIAFRILREEMEKTYGKDLASRRIIATTDASKGALRVLAEKEGYRTFVIPDDVGGRFSVLTPVGLLPIAVAGISIKSLLEGAAALAPLSDVPDLINEPSGLYAALRYVLYCKGKGMEIMAVWNDRLKYVAEWWKQLFGESEGKEGRGIFPASVTFPTDLHSLGQWIQEGPRDFFETFLVIRKNAFRMEIPRADDDLDGLSYLAGKDIGEVCMKACEGTAMAHQSGHVPCLSINMPELSDFYLGQLLYLFERAVGLGGYLLGINPFDQPGVEAYKKNMFRLLGKPGS
ncbi:MAG: glucose-6-phosphate isomerase [bacterium]